MAGLMLMAMIVVMVVVLFVQLVRQKPIKKLLLSYLLILGSFHLFVSYSCGPNSADVKVMKPMAQKIADHIVAHGIPKSLADIPDLPYGVEGCERSEEYHDYKSNIVVKNKAMIYKIREKCNYANGNISIYFGVTLWLKDNTWDGMLKLTSSNETVLFYPFESDNNKTFKFDDMDIGSRKDDGICNPMRH